MSNVERLSVLDGGPTGAERDTRLAKGADELTTQSSGILAHPRFLLTLASALMTFGLCVILLGWLGAAHSTLVEEQVPYLISGGVLGLALSLIGAVTLFAHWINVLVRENREREAVRRQDHIELMGALRDVAAALEQQEDHSNGSARSSRAERPLRRAPRRS